MKNNKECQKCHDIIISDYLYTYCQKCMNEIYKPCSVCNVKFNTNEGKYNVCFKCNDKKYKDKYKDKCIMCFKLFDGKNGKYSRCYLCNQAHLLLLDDYRNRQKIKA